MHFVLLGGAIFGVYRLAGGHTGHHDNGDAPLVVRAETVASLSAELGRKLGRPPTETELDAAVQAFVDRELLVREARRIGLDEGDPVVRRRLVQKLQMVHEDLEASDLPSDETLRAFVEAHAERYALDARADIRHFFFSKARHEDPDALARAAAGRLAQLGETATLPESQAGDPFPHGRELHGRSRRQLDGAFGPGFGDAVFGLERGTWSVLESTYGTHVVLLESTQTTHSPEFAAVRNRALADWLEQRRERARTDALEALRAGAEWTVEKAP